MPTPGMNGHQPPPENASFQHYRANNYDNRNKMIWNNTDFRIFNRDNPRSLGGPIPTLEETQVRAVLEQRKMRGYSHRMPLDDPEIQQKLGVANMGPLRLEEATGVPGQPQHIQQKMMLQNMQHSDHLLRQQNLIRDSFLTVAPVQKDQVLPQQIPKGQMIDSL